MSLTEHCYSVLVVSSHDKMNDALKKVLPEERYNPVVFESDAASARRVLVEKGFDIVIINTPLPDDFGTHLALDVCENSGTGVLLLVRSEHFPDINSRVEPFGVLTLAKPTSSQMIAQSLGLLCGTRERIRRMEQKTATIEEKMEEIRIVNHAKWMLIEQLKMSESEAHRYIEKQAMDRCVTRRAVAEDILQTYK